jgi:hypothetical protein
MRIPGSVILILIIVLGAIVLSPVVAFLELGPLPGDITFNWQNQHVFLPFTQSLIASVSLALLFLWARK